MIIARLKSCRYHTMLWIFEPTYSVPCYPVSFAKRRPSRSTSPLSGIFQPGQPSRSSTPQSLHSPGPQDQETLSASLLLRQVAKSLSRLLHEHIPQRGGDHGFLTHDLSPGDSFWFTNSDSGPELERSTDPQNAAGEFCSSR